MTRLKQARLARELSQHALARLSKIPQPTISLIERRRLAPLPEHLERLSVTFGIPVSELLEDAHA